MSEILLVRAAIAPLNAEPRAGSEQVTQALSGHRLEPIEERAPWLRVRMADGYEGWVHRGYLQTMSAHEFAARYAVGRVSLDCVVRIGDGHPRPLPLRAVLPDDAVIERGVALAPDALARRFLRVPVSIARTALEYFAGTPYQWGGVTPWGADCSGLVQATFALHGIHLPRDARQQAEVGTLVPGALDALQPADLVFFSECPDAPITHVAIAIGDRRIVHLALGRGGYAVEDLGNRDDEYVRGLVGKVRVVRRVV